MWRKKEEKKVLHGLLKDSLINVNNQFHIGFKNQQTNKPVSPHSQGLCIGLIQTYSSDKWKDIKKHLWNYSAAL